MSLAVELHQAHKARLERIAMAAERHLASKQIALLEPPKPEPAPEPIPEPEPIDDGWIEQEPAKLDAEAEPPPIYQPPIRTIQQATCDIYGVTLIDLLSSRRTANVVRPRQVAMYLAKTLTLRSLPEIGRRFGGRDHTTVLHAVRKITQLIQTDSNLADKIASIKERLNGLD